MAEFRQTNKLGYVPALDGLRAVAVLSVVVAHSGTGLVGTAIGVDIFFVLSGFLITHLLVEEWRATGRIGIRNFYVRRILRLWPALWVMVLGTSAALLLLGIQGAKARTMGFGAVSALLYVSNWVRAFGGNADIYSHTWSLGVEDQFYIVWAVLLPLGLRTIGFVGMRRLILSGIGIVIAWRLCLLLSGASMARLYNGFDTHSDGCLAGCALAFFLLDGDWHASLRNMLQRFGMLGGIALAGLMIIAVISPAADEAGFFALVSPLVALLSVVVIADIVTRRGRLGRLLGLRPLVHLGVISYGVYLWHYPLIVALHYAPNRIPQSPVATILIGLVGSIAMAELSYRLVERPCLRLKVRFGHAARYTSDLADTDTAVAGVASVT
jgi:peptidoglycan/LPS O-acetylase OafA/YrhL